MADPLRSVIPAWLRNQILVEDALRFAPRPSVDEVVARMGLPRPRTTEDFLRQLANEARLGEGLAIRATDDALTQDANVFGLPVKTIEQGRSLGERNLPGIEDLSPEDQIALAQALDKGAMLRAMTGRSSDPTMSRSAGRIRIEPANRADQLTGRGTPFGLTDDLDMGGAMALLQNKRDFRRLTGLNPDLPNPPAFTRNLRGETVPSETAQTLGDDVADLAATIRQDQIDSKVMQIDELQKAALQEEMARSADEVGRMEARAREYGGLPPETLSEMDAANRRHLATMSGQSERLSGNPTYNWARQMGGNMDPVVESPLYPKRPTAQPISEGETAAEYQWRTQGKDLLKGMAIGHVLSYPAMYAAYRYTQDQWPFGGKEPGASKPAFPEQGPAIHHGTDGEKEDDAFLAVADSLPPVAVDLPEMPVIRTQETQVGIPEDDSLAIDAPGDDAALAAESTPIPSAPDLDALLAASGLINPGTSPEMAARRRAVWQKMRPEDDLNALMREAGLGGYEGDLSLVDRDYLRRRGSAFSPDSLNYRLEQEYLRRGGNPYPQLAR